ncbi:basic amino acid ABC transporter substrate-binding protein [Sporolactobacillus spathodeae]
MMLIYLTVTIHIKKSIREENATMKKITFFSLVLALILALSACGSAGSSSSSTKSTSQKKVLRVVNDATYAPFEYLKNGKMVGFDVDVMKALGKASGYQYKLENVGWDPVFAELKNKTADIGVSAISITSDRAKTYDFSKPYFLSTNMILVPKSSKIKTAQDLKGKTIAVQQGTTGQVAMEKIMGKNNPKIKKFKTITLAIMEMLNHGADAVVADDTVIRQYAMNNPGKGLKVIPDKKAFANEYYGLMYPKDSKYVPVFDKAIKKILEDGTYTKIYEKWFKVKPDVKTLLAQQK